MPEKIGCGITTLTTVHNYDAPKQALHTSVQLSASPRSGARSRRSITRTRRAAIGTSICLSWIRYLQNLAQRDQLDWTELSQITRMSADPEQKDVILTEKPRRNLGHRAVLRYVQVALQLDSLLC